MIKYPDTAPRLDVLYKIEEWCDGSPGSHRWSTDRNSERFTEQSCVCGATLRMELTEIGDEQYRCTTIYERYLAERGMREVADEQTISRLYGGLIADMERREREFVPPYRLVGHVSGRRYISIDGLYFHYELNRDILVRETDGYEVTAFNWEEYNRNRWQRMRERHQVPRTPEWVSYAQNAFPAYPGLAQAQAAVPEPPRMPEPARRPARVRTARIPHPDEPF